MSRLSEHEIQKAIFEYVRLKEKSDWRFGLIYAVPNGGKRDKKTAIKLKLEGVKSGVFDIVIDYAAQGFHGARLETKKPGEKLSPEQVEMSALYRKAGLLPLIVRSVAQFINFTEVYFE